MAIMAHAVETAERPLSGQYGMNCGGVRLWVRPLRFTALRGRALAGLPPALEGFFIASVPAWERGIVAGPESTGHGPRAPNARPAHRLQTYPEASLRVSRPIRRCRSHHVRVRDAAMWAARAPNLNPVDFD
jgi:hypothetical protein